MSRSRLHIDHLQEFATFCETRGWKTEKPKGTYEVLRMRHPEWRDPLFVYKRHTNSSGGELVHLTTHGNADNMVSAWLRDKKRTKDGQPHQTPQEATP